MFVKSAQNIAQTMDSCTLTMFQYMIRSPLAKKQIVELNHLPYSPDLALHNF